MKQFFNKFKGLNETFLIIFLVFTGIFLMLVFYSPKADLTSVQSENTAENLDIEKLMEGIKHAESQREDLAADSLIKATSDEEIYNNPYIKHLRLAFNGYLDGTNNGLEEGVTEKMKMDDGLMCGLDSFNRAYFWSSFSVLGVEKNDYGGISIYMTFNDYPDRIFWVWIYPYDEGNYVLRGFCEDAALIPLDSDEKP